VLAVVVIGEPSHPQVLFDGFSSDEPAYLRMAALVPSARLLPPKGFAELRAVEWDVLVAKQVDVSAPGHMHVLAFGCPRLGPEKTADHTSEVRYSDAQPSQQMTVPDGHPDRLRRLVLNELVPWLQQRVTRPYLVVAFLNGVVRQIEHDPAAWLPFVLDADGNTIAGAFERGSRITSGGWCWALPHVPDRPELWLAAALQDWHERTPDRVPALPGWRSRLAWRTRREADALAALEALQTERDDALARYEQQEARLSAAADAAAAAADAEERRLLTAQGATLVEAVAVALRSLGFDVEDADSAPTPEGTPKVEDLRVRDPDDPTWTNITEVRGYKAGAKVSDLLRLARFAGLHAIRTGSIPLSRWYVVNQFFDDDPDTRRAPLAGSEDDIAVFAEDGGLVIDTRELFNLQQLVDDGTVAPAQARAHLRQARGALAPAGLPILNPAAPAPG